MNALDNKLTLERDRLARTLGALAAAVSALPIERVADLLPLLVPPVEKLDQHARNVGLLRAYTTDALDGASASDPVDPKDILR